MEARTRSTSPLPIFAQADHWFRRARAALLEALPCRKGCSRCCIGPFPITVFDIDELQRGLAVLPSERRATIIERAVRQTTAIRTAYPILVDDRSLDGWTDQSIDELVTQFADLPCPALQADGSCGIYAFRPVTCRTMGVPVETAGVMSGACDVQTSVPIVRLPRSIRDEEDRFAEQEARAIAMLQETRTDAGEEVLLPFGFLPEPSRAN
jgi:Fe-S-cluster containining protein